jgi:hypothetical protein
MAKHDDLDILLDAAETMNPKKLDGATDQTEEEREGHDRRGSLQTSGLVKLAFGFVHPHRYPAGLQGSIAWFCRPQSGDGKEPHPPSRVNNGHGEPGPPRGRREPDGNPLGDESGPTGRVFRLPHADGCAPVVARLSDPCRRRPQRTVPRPVDLHVSIRTSRCLPVR